MTKLNEILTRILNSNVLRWLLRVAIFFIITYLSIISAVVSYSSFRWYIVPSRGWSLPVNLQYGLGKVPFDTVSIPMDSVSPDQTYDLSLELKVPNDINNLNLGNFMITLELENTFSNELVASKPALLTWQHPNVLTSLIFKKAQKIKVPLSSTILKPSTRSLRQMSFTAATVTVGRHDWIADNVTLPQKELHVYDASLLFNIKLVGLSWLLVTFPITSFVIFTAGSFILIWSVAMLVWCGTNQSGQLTEDDEDHKALPEGEEETQDKETEVSSREETPVESVTLDGESISSSQWRSYDSDSEPAETPSERSLTPSNANEDHTLRQRVVRDNQQLDEDDIAI
ncbi:hypothetical protein E3Q09_02071 [Wallemia mellicola]|nr:hypothetical protein E3Q09_02071 [Wallemia mellicola]